MKMLARTLILLAAFDLLSQVAHAQQEEVLWAARAGGTSSDYAVEIALEQAGLNSAITGYFGGTLQIGSNSLPSAGGLDILVAKYDGMSNVLWAKNFGGSLDEYGESITIDHSNNIIVVGQFSSSTVAFGGTTLSNQGNADIFIAKLDAANGNVLWAKQVGGSNFAVAQSVTTDGAGNIIISGRFFGAAVFVGTTKTLTSSGEADILVAKYDASGNLLWAVKAGGTGFDRALDVATDSQGNIFITGDFAGAATFGASPNAKTVTSAGGSDVFVAKYDAAGNLRWVKSAGGTLNDRGIAIGINTLSSEDVIVAGTFFGTATFTKNNGAKINLTSAGGSDIFIAQYLQNSLNNQNDSGDLFKVTRAGGASTDFVNNLAVPGADFFITGFFQNSTQFGDTTLQSAGGDDIFLAKVDSGLNPIWAIRVGGASTDQANGVAAIVNNEGNYDLRITGTFQGTVTFQGNPSRTITSNGSDDIFVARYGVPQPDNCTRPDRLPSNVVATAVGSRRINVTWQDNSNDEDEFIILRDSTGTGNFVEIARVPANTTMYSDTTVAPEISYMYRIDVQCPAGVGEGGTDPSTPPAAPSNSTAKATSHTSILVTWKDNSNINTGYYIERRLATGTSFSQVGDAPGATAQSHPDNNGLQPNTNYDYRVRAYNGDDVSDYSNIATAITLAAPPTLASPADGATDVPINPILSWSASPGATSYQLQISNMANFATTVVDQSGITPTSFQVSGLANGTQYFWRVNAANAGGTSAFSGTRSFTTIVAPPQPPTLASPDDGATEVPINPTLRWNASSNATSYQLQVSTAASFSPPLFLDRSGIAQTSFQVSGLANGTQYFWRVNATNAGGTSAFSDARSFTTIAAPPQPPTLASPDDGATEVPINPTLSWNASPNATSYQLQVSTAASFSPPLFLDRSGIAQTSFQVSGLANGTQYFWRVSAANAGGTSAFSSARSFTTVAAPPQPPTLASPDDGATEVSINPTLSWNASPNATSYQLQVSTAASFSPPLFLDRSGIAQTSLQVSGLSNGTQYFWHVSAANAGGASAFSGTRSFTTVAAPPQPPTLASPDDGATEVSINPTLSWNASPNATSYQLQVSTAASFSPPLFLDRSGIAQTSLQVSGLSNGTQYFWHVSAANAGGASAFSGTRSFTTIAAPPQPPTLASPEDGATEVSINPTLSWNASPNATSYQLQVSTAASFSPPLFLDRSGIAQTSFQVSGLANGTQYFWRVSAANAGGTSAFSDARSFTTVAAPPQPPTLALPADGATEVPTSPTLIWNASLGATSYQLQIASTSNFSSLVIDQSGIAQNFYSASGLLKNTTYYWHAKAANAGGTSDWSAAWRFTTGVTSVEQKPQALPGEYRLNQNFPNPFNPSTRISYDLPKPSATELEILDFLGNQVRILVKQLQPAGHYSIYWDGRNHLGQIVPSGIYIYRLTAGSFVQSRKMLLLR